MGQKTAWLTPGRVKGCVRSTWFSARWVCRRTPGCWRASWAAALIRSLVTLKGAHGASPILSIEYLHATAPPSLVPHPPPVPLSHILSCSPSSVRLPLFLPCSNVSCTAPTLPVLLQCFLYCAHSSCPAPMFPVLLPRLHPCPDISSRAPRLSTSAPVTRVRIYRRAGTHEHVRKHSNR
jgi:hypothetical protein